MSTEVSRALDDFWTPSEANETERLKLDNGFEIRKKRIKKLFELTVWLKHIIIREKLVGNPDGDPWESERIANVEQYRLERLFSSLTDGRLSAENRNDSWLGLEWESVDDFLPNRLLCFEESTTVLLTLKPEFTEHNRSKVILFPVIRKNQTRTANEPMWSTARRGMRDLEIKYTGKAWAYLTPEVFNRLDY